MRNKAGFTLIEIMVSLVLVGVIAAISGTSVITATRSYLFAKENDAITQKAQLALGRLNREFIELSDIKDANGTCVVYESPYGMRAVASVEGTVRFFSDYGNTTCPTTGGDILIDGVKTFTIRYNPLVIAGMLTDTWVFNISSIRDPNSPYHISQLYAVQVELALARPDTGGDVKFSATVSPRNNNNSGGAALPSAANPPPEYSGKQCFVTTAAYGDADHPVVIVLRQFRDRVLLPTEPGKAVVRYYYEVGPSLAAAIEDKPIACLLVRLLVTPLAGFALLTMSCPILIPLILLLSWGLARLILREMRRRSLRMATRFEGQRGAMLVTLIAAMVVFSALGAVMVGMFGTAALSQASGNNSQRAYYLAESGFRYAASRYIAVNLGSETANEAARETLLETELHAKTFSLSPGDGVFRLDVYPYYYKSTQAPTGNELPAKVSGGLPGLEYKPGSWVKVIKPGTTTPEYIRISGVSTLAPSTIRFYRIEEVYPPSVQKNWGASFTTGSLVTPVCILDRDVNGRRLIGPDSDGRYDLAFKADSGAHAFPEKNGIFMVKFEGETNPRILSYRLRDISTNRLKGISDPNGGSLPTGPMVDPGSALPFTNFVEQTKFMRIESTGTFGTGSSAVSRKVTYYTPIGYARAEQVPKTKFHDDMQDLTKWQRGDDIGRIGTSTPGTSYGTTMKVDTSQSVYTLPGGSCLKYREFQVGLNWSGAGIPIQQEWLRTGNYLSYDMEMKTFFTLINPMVKHAMGLTFRLDDKGNALGFTYARGIAGFDAYGCDQDGIPFGWFWSGYADYTPVLLFWMKLYDKQETNLTISPSPCSPTPPTTIGEPPLCGRATKAILTYRGDWQNGERVRFTNTGGSLPPPIVPGKDYYIRKILYNSDTYLYLFSNETGALYFDPLWPGLQDITDYGLGTTTIIAQDPTFTKLAHQVLTPGNEYYNIMTSYYLKGFATFMARVMEAPSVSFVNGGGTAGREILSGETVYQTSNNLRDGTVNAIYKVMRSPFYRAAKSGGLRLWSSGTEQGVIMLERIAGESLSNPSTAPFTAGSKIFVGEHPGGTHAGTVDLPGGVTDAVFRVRDNWLMFFVGDADNPSTKVPDTNPFNNYRGSVLRNSVLWPPDNPEDTAINTDNFTLLRFSDYVNQSLSCKVNGVDRTGIYCLTGFYSKDNTGSAGDVLRFASPDGTLFFSPQSGVVLPTSRSEVGLHAYGNDGHFTEFDDFALQFGPGPGPSRKGFLMPIQQ